MTTGKANFRPDIEGLRAFAVLFVMAFHARILWCTGGFIGVDLFFVLSGYLITEILLREADRTGRVALGSFYARRVRRLLPACSLMVLTTGIASFFVLPPLEQAAVSRSVLATSAYLSNIYFYYLRSDYFATDPSNNPLLHTWSLGVEEQFYFIWPLLILGTSRLRQRRKVACFLIGAIGLLSFMSSAWLMRTNQPAAFFLMPPRAWEFAIGALASQIPQGWLQARAAHVRSLGWLGLTAISISAFIASPIGFPGWKAVLPVCGAAAVLIGGAVQDPLGVGRLLSLGPLPYLGQRSYALYLWHWPMIILLSIANDPFPLRLRILCLLASLVMAEFSFRFVENPIRFSTYLQPRTTLCMGIALLVMLLGSSGSLAWRRWAVHTESYRRFGGSIADLPSDVAQGCLNDTGNATPHPCFFGSTSPSKTVILMGHSHMEQWLPTFQQIADSRGWRIILYVKSACPALAIVAVPYYGGPEDPSCVLWRQQTIREMSAQRPTAVILSNASWYPEIDRPMVKQSPDKWSAGAKKTFAELHKEGLPVIFLRDTPFAGYEVVQCLSRADWSRFASCSVLMRHTALDDAMYRAQQEGAQGIPQVSFIDMNDWICDVNECPLTRGNTIVYRDKTHITATFARSLSADLYQQLVRALPGLGS